MHRLLCLGQLSLVDGNGQPVANAAAQPRRLALLALLGRSAPRAISRERLIGWFWPDADEERGRRSLNQALYALRTELGSEEVLLGQRDIRLNLDLVSCDVADFEMAVESGRLEDAAALYRGPFADGFHLNSAPEFGQWLEEERRVLAHRYAEALESLATAAEARGETQTAVSWWRKAANAEPSSARLALRLMRALARAGDSAGAIRHATIYESILQLQLEIPPDPAVREFAEELKRSPPPGRAVSPALPAAPAASVAEMEPKSAVAVAPPAPEPAAAVPAAVPERPAVRGRRSRYLLAAALVGLLVLGSLGVRALLSARDTDNAVDSGAPVVAVLPLENETGDSTFNLVGPAVTDWVTHSLAQTGLVRVVDTRTLLTARDDIRQMVTDIGARYLVVGKVFRRADSLEYSSSIVEAATGHVIAPIDPVSAPVSDPTGALKLLEEKVTGALAVVVDRRLSNYSARGSQPPTWAAYSEFLLGLRDFGRHRDFNTNFLHFARAARLDTTYWQARLWAGISLANARRYPEADSIFRAVEARRDQLAAFDRASLDYFYQGFVLGDREAAYHGARRMAELAPLAGHANWAVGNTARSTLRFRESVKWYSRINLNSGWGAEWAVRILGEQARGLHMLGEHEQELKNAREMQARAPRDGWAHSVETTALAALRRYGELAARVEAAVALPDDPGTWIPYSAGTLLWEVSKELRGHGAPADTVRRYGQAAIDWYAPLTAAGVDDTLHLLGHARALHNMERWAEARTLYERLAAINPESPEYLGGVGATSAHLGDTARAEAMIRQLTALKLPFPFGRPARWAGTIAAALGRPEEAVRFLGQSLREGSGRFDEWHGQIDFLTLRDYRPFRDLTAPRD
jgi:DNA-binding SARP family transcriptional activator/TolB-like protein